MRQSVRPSFLRALALTVLAALLGPGLASADLVPAPIPECVGKPDGTFCKLPDGTAGQCLTNTDSRRPGRTWQTCKKDEHECDRLAVGAECHGYLGRPAHCREFNDSEKNTRWRTCQVDDAGAAPAAGTDTAAPATTPAAPAAAPAKKGILGCTMAPHASADPLVAAAGLALLLLAVSRRRLAA